MGIFVQYLNNGGRFSQHTHFWVTSRNVTGYEKCSNGRLKFRPNTKYILENNSQLSMATGKVYNVYNYLLYIVDNFPL